MFKKLWYSDQTINRSKEIMRCSIQEEVCEFFFSFCELKLLVRWDLFEQEEYLLGSIFYSCDLELKNVLILPNLYKFSLKSAHLRASEFLEKLLNMMR